MKAIFDELRSQDRVSTRLTPAAPPLIAGVATAAAAAVLLGPVGPPGLALTLCAWGVVLPGVLALQHAGRERGRRRPLGGVRTALVVVMACLFGVFTLRDSGWLLLMCGAAGAGLAAMVLVDARSLARALAALPLIGDAVLRAPVWAAPALPAAPPRQVLGPWVRGLVIGGIVTAAIGGLLASADVVFAQLIVDALPTSNLGDLTARLVAGTVAGLLALGGAYAASSASRAVHQPQAAPARHPAEWLLPVGLTALMLAAFMAVQVTALFPGTDAVLSAAGVTPAERARQGFGQLAIVTVLVTLLLGWAARCARGSQQRRIFGAAGGTTLVLTALLAVSALRRLWLYQGESGWTVRRVNAGAFEVWVVLVLTGLAVLWLSRREDLAVRMVAGSAGLGLLCVALAGPDAVVARADVTRYERTGAIDPDYLAGLSSGAVPALDQLTEPLRSCILGQLVDRQRGGNGDAGAPSGGWRHWNLDRHRAMAVLGDGPVQPARPSAGCAE